MKYPDSEQLAEIAGRFLGQEVLVAGDVILDRFVWGRVERISPEAPVPVVEVQRESLHLGGAANVAANLAALGARPLLVGLVGGDEDARDLRSELIRRGIDDSGLIADRSRRTTTKTRIIAGHQQVCRADREDRSKASSGVLRAVLENCRERFAKTSTAILSDYAKGVVTRDLTARLTEQARREGRFVAVDPKSPDFSAYQGASLATPNKKEAEAAAGVPIVDDDTLVQAAQRLRRQADLKGVLVTRGEEGMSYIGAEAPLHIPTAAREVYDVTGAGDTVIAVFALAAACGATPRQAAQLANHAAGVVVAKLGTAQPTVEELLESIRGG